MYMQMTYITKLKIITFSNGENINTTNKEIIRFLPKKKKKRNEIKFRVPLYSELFAGV